VRVIQQVGAGGRDLQTLELAGAGSDGLGHDWFLSTVKLRDGARGSSFVV
jgi:hypothetical protein